MAFLRVKQGLVNLCDGRWIVNLCDKRFLLRKPVENMIVVSAADSSHFKSLCQFLGSFFRYEKEASRVIVYDLGLQAVERREIGDRFPSVEMRTFDYSRYPEHLDIKVNHGEYAWKPVIIAEVLEQFLCPVCWMDAGCLITEPLLQLRRMISCYGFLFSPSNGQVRDWTHPKTFDFLGCKDDLWDSQNLAAGLVPVNPRFSDVMPLIRQWRKCALTKECIAPEGSSRGNHRQDQAVLTLLVHQSETKWRWIVPVSMGISLQHDID